MDAAEYKHLVLGLIFVKYVSDKFAARRNELERRFTDPNDEYFLDDPELIPEELEDRDYYKSVNVFWVPESARWETLRAFAKQADILDDPELIPEELEDRDYYKSVNVFWVPESARWETLRAFAKQADIGKRWGGDCFTLTAEHIEALRNGKLIALDIMSEYVAVVRLDEQTQKGAGL